MIALALAMTLGTAPLVCPAGAEHRGAPPPDDLEEWCERKDAVGRARRDGPARRFYDDGGLWVDERYADGERHGPYLEYHRGGAKAREGAYARGYKIGRWRVWSPAGILEEDSEFRDGVPDGVFLAYWPSGARRTEGRHCGGMQCGIWRTWDERGALLGTAEYAIPARAP